MSRMGEPGAYTRPTRLAGAPGNVRLEDGS